MLRKCQSREEKSYYTTGGTIIKMDIEERCCPVSESIEESLKQMKLMRDGKLAKTTWDDFLSEINKDNWC